MNMPCYPHLLKIMRTNTLLNDLKIQIPLQIIQSLGSFSLIYWLKKNVTEFLAKEFCSSSIAVYV